MFASSRTTLFCLVAVCLAATVVDAHDATLQRREHVNLNRMMKKRSPQNLEDLGITLNLPVGAGAKPTDSASGSASVSSTSGAGSSTSSGTTSATASESTTSGTSSSTTTSSSVASESSTSSGTTSESSTTSTSSSTTAAEASKTPEPNQLEPSSNPATVTVGVKSTKTHTVSVEATNAPSMTGATAQKKSNVLTILIATVASVGGVFILWTVFRKWKLGSSKKFDQRLKPIDWQPTTNDDDFDPLRRQTSTSSAHGRNNNSALNPIPDHDFTAGPAHVSPVGGYADLARGPSPQPQMSGLNRGASFNRGYDSSIPPHGGRY